MCGVTSSIRHDQVPMAANGLAKTALGTAVAEAIDRAVKTGIWPDNPKTYVEAHVAEAKAVLDTAGIVPVVSECPIKVVFPGIGPISGRIDLVCRDVDGGVCLLDVKTYRAVTEVERAQVSMYYHMASLSHPIRRIGLLVIPTAGAHLGGYIIWVDPMPLDTALRVLGKKGGSRA